MPLESKTLADAVAAAQAFLDAVEALRERHAKDKDFREMFNASIGIGFKETAAVRRTSMTLTRTLADVRRRAK
jgi:hypothetical protein